MGTSRLKWALIVLVAGALLILVFSRDCSGGEQNFRVDETFSVKAFGKDSSQVSFTVHNLLNQGQTIQVLVQYKQLDKKMVRGKYEGPKVQNIFHYLTPYETLDYSLILPNGVYKIRVYRSWQKDVIPQQKIFVGVNRYSF